MTFKPELITKSVYFDASGRTLEEFIEKLREFASSIQGEINYVSLDTEGGYESEYPAVKIDFVRPMTPEEKRRVDDQKKNILDNKRRMYETLKKEFGNDI